MGNLSGTRPVALSCVILFFHLAHQVHGDTCYSSTSGFFHCTNGCCGPADKQDCCSQTLLIVGLAVGGVVVVGVIFGVVLCLTCGDGPPPKICGCCGRRGGEGEERRRRTRGLFNDRRRRNRDLGRSGFGRRVTMVHPVHPPDYSTATQDRAPSVQPGRSHRILPVSPPPPYTETVPPPPGVPPHRRAGQKTGTTAAPADSRPVGGNMAPSATEPDGFGRVVGPPSSNGGNASTTRTAPSLLERYDSDPQDNTLDNARFSISPADTSTDPAAPGGEAPVTTTTARRADSRPGLIHVRESLRTGGPRQSGGTTRGGRSGGGSDNHPQGVAVLHTVNETAAEDGDLGFV
ncbi:uncharacterized protein LOC143285174 [Babylonia areolata]|uniref:uncharacterized protein LOC143285174 n=1 Tax=Babylonia areolata TaxID=304850 RepID=UPI003FD465BC